MERDCDECDWVETTSLNSIRRSYILGMPCAEHAAPPRECVPGRACAEHDGLLFSTFDTLPPRHTLTAPCVDCRNEDFLDVTGRCWVCADLRELQRTPRGWSAEMDGRLAEIKRDPRFPWPMREPERRRRRVRAVSLWRVAELAALGLAVASFLGLICILVVSVALFFI
jgi:hypothetical protein